MKRHKTTVKSYKKDRGTAECDGDHRGASLEGSSPDARNEGRRRRDNKAAANDRDRTMVMTSTVVRHRMEPETIHDTEEGANDSIRGLLRCPADSVGDASQESVARDAASDVGPLLFDDIMWHDVPQPLGEGQEGEAIDGKVGSQLRETVHVGTVGEWCFTKTRVLLDGDVEQWKVCADKVSSVQSSKSYPIDRDNDNAFESDENLEDVERGSPPHPSERSAVEEAQVILVPVVSAGVSLASKPNPNPLVVEGERIPNHRRRNILFLVVIVVIIVVVAIVVGVTVTRGNRSTTVNGGTSPTASPTFRPISVDEFMNEFQSRVGDATLKAMQDPATPQHSAYEWLRLHPALSTDGTQDPVRRLATRFSLATFFYATGGNTSWTSSDGWLNYSLHECNWLGCACDYATSSLRVLLINQNGLSGTIPPELSLLESLFDLTLLQNPNLAGTIPTELCLLTNLKNFTLGINSLSGRLPTELGRLSCLEQLWLLNNDLTGPIPTELSALTALQSVLLPNNQLTGGLSNDVTGAWSNLRELWLHTNRLTGSLAFLTNLKSLTRIQLSSNRFRGRIPTEVGRLLNLTELLLSGNELTGEIPSEIGDLVVLTDLWLYRNKLSGKIPSNIGRLTRLENLYMGENRLSGSLPTEIGLLKMLEKLEVNANFINGTIPSQIGQLTALTEFWALESFLKGPIPSELGRLTNLVDLSIANNPYLNGTIPSEIAMISSLKILMLSYNDLSGVIPPELGNLAQVQSVSLSGNRLSRTIPAEVGRLTQLNSLTLFENSLSGLLPSEVGKLSMLTNFQLHENQIRDKIPTEIGLLTRLDVLSLAENRFTGPIPTEIGNIRTLRGLWLEGNQLTSTLPTELGKLKLLTNAHLYNNSLTGSIPSELGSIPTLDELLLQDNRLGGSLPPQLCALRDADTANVTVDCGEVTCACECFCGANGTA